MSETFPEWHPNLNKKHFPRSADSEWVSVLAGQRSDGVIVPLQVALVDGTTDQYALTVNTEISLPPITIGKVIIQGIDTQGLKHDLEALPNADGMWSLSVESPTLAQESSQLTQIALLDKLIVSNSEGMTNIISALNGLCINIGKIDVNTDELELLMRLNTATVADGITLMLATMQSSTISIQDGLTDMKLELLEGLTNIITLVAQEVTQLSTLESLIRQQSLSVESLLSQEVTQLSDIQIRVSTEVTQLSILSQLQGLTFDSPALAQETTQLSILQELEGLCINFDAPSLAQEVTQLSILQDLQGLCFNFSSTTLNQEVTQLSVLQTLEGLSVSVTIASPHGKYYVNEATQAAGLTDVLYDFGARMQDVYLSVSQPVSVKFNSTLSTPIPVFKGQFDFNWQNAEKIYVTTTVTTNLQIYANGGTV